MNSCPYLFQKGQEFFMRTTLLQRELILWLIFFLLVSATGTYYINHTPNDHPGMIRLHVIANSDSKEDQALKLAVRDGILEFMDGQDSIDDARQYINDNIDEIEQISEKIIEENGYDYPVRAKLGVSFIPQKSYEDLTLPAGNYEALKVTLGKGDGHNWWCVIFPQLCLVGKKDKKDKIILKSKVKEIMKSN